MTKEFFMQEALKEARKAYEKGEVPIGVVLVRDNEIIARGHNLRELTNDPTTHAEVSAIREASQVLENWRLLEVDMYVTLEPCVMCCGAIVLSRIRKVYYGASDYKGGTAGSLMNLLENTPFNHQVEVEAGVLKVECEAILKQFFKDLRTKRKNEKRKFKKLEILEELKK